MFFCGIGFCGYKETVTATNIGTIDKMTVTGVKVNDIFGSMDLQATTYQWDNGTIFYGKFENNLFIGNLELAINTTSSVRIKIRKKGEFKWKTIYSIPITTGTDFKFERIYPYAPIGTFEIALVPLVSGAESNYTIMEINSDFTNYYLIQSDVIYPMILNTDLQVTHNRDATYVKTLGRSKPKALYNGKAKYDSGTMTCTFIEFDRTNCTWKTEDNQAFLYRDNVNEFLQNGKPTVLKTFDGRIWGINIDSTIPENNEYYKMPIHQISWTETFDVNSTSDMYNNGLLDVDIEGV